MINIQQLEKIFNPYIYYITKEVNYIQIHYRNNYKNLIIYIINDKDYILINQRYNNCIRKNLIKRRFHNEIYIHEDYIKFIIRQITK
jgi:hypothetical protein